MNANSKQPAPKIEQWLHEAASQLKTAGIPTARLDAELILAHVLNKNRTWLLAHSNEPISDSSVFSGSAFPAERRDTNAPLERSEPEKTELSEIAQADGLLNKRLDRIPLAYLTSYKEFYGRNFIVTPDVLIPRPETETLITVIKQLDLLENPNIHDVGTGSGCIAITIALELPASTVSASDISLDAVLIARQNAKQLNAGNVLFRKDHLMSSYHGPYDAIVANLPYVDHDWQRSPETDHEPALALFADEHGLSLIKECIQQAATRLVAQGYLVLEAGSDQHAAIIDFAQHNGFNHLRTDDYIVTLQR